MPLCGFLTNDVDFDLSGDGGDVVLQVKAVDALVRTDARGDRQLCEGGLCRHGDALVRGAQLLLPERPLGRGGRVSGDGNSDGQRLRDDHFQNLPETAQVARRTNCGEREREKFSLL